MSFLAPDLPAERWTTRNEGVARQHGALPWRIARGGGVDILLVTSRARGRWTLPKGWPTEGRTPARTAAREAFEEAGVIGTPGDEPVGSYRYMKLRGDGTLETREVTLFGLQVKGTLLNWPEKGERRRRWLPLADAIDMVAEPGLATLLRSLRHGEGVFA